MNTKSIRFKLIAWYAGLLLAVMTAFGAYTYQRLNHYLSLVLTRTLSDRALRIGTATLANISQTGADYVPKEIKLLYAPEVNDRMIRITRPDGSTLYISGIPIDKSFDPTKLRPGTVNGKTGQARRESTGIGTSLLIVSVPFYVGDQRFIIEVGASEEANNEVLHNFLLALIAGITAVITLAIGGGFILINQALAPVQKLIVAAQAITLHHLDKRLPLVNTGDEIERLSNTLNRMIERLEKSFQINSRFAADASHELRTPLTIIHGELEAMLLKKTLPQETRETLDSLFEETGRLSKIVAGLLSLSRLDSGEAQMERVKFDLAELAATTAEQMCLLALEKEITLSCDANDHVKVEGDRSRLKQVIVNLLDNAIKYTPPRGQISLLVKTSNSKALLAVSNTGMGIPETALPHIFERFYRADETRSRAVEGAGLGLSIVKSICNAHGGRINVENLQTGGCCFQVELPLAD